MNRFLLTAMLVLLSSVSSYAQRAPSPIIGRWQYKTARQEVVIEFRSDATYYQLTKNAGAEQQIRGHFVLRGDTLELLADRHFLPQRLGCLFHDPDRMALTFPSGESVIARRVVQAQGEPPGAPDAAKADPVRLPRTEANPAGDTLSSGARKPQRLFLPRVWESNQKAFSFLLPPGWVTSGGMFTDGSGQTKGAVDNAHPKCDFAVGSDPRGNVMIRWLPSWTYATPSAKGPFRSEGLPVKPLAGARQFMVDLLSSERPQASDIRLIAEDAANEISIALGTGNPSGTSAGQTAATAAVRVESLTVLVEYIEGGTRYREAITTSILDNTSESSDKLDKGRALKTGISGDVSHWSNHHTVTFRAPASDFEFWKPILDLIRVSRDWSAPWLAAVEQKYGRRAKDAMEMEANLETVSATIVESRRNSLPNASQGQEQWMYVTGRQEFQNPFTGGIEAGTAFYRHRWENDRGDVIYTDDDAFDPNSVAEYSLTTWKRAAEKK